VVLVHFWTYTCINCKHTIPYLNEWYAKYADEDFTIIGVHSPEFDFEKDIDNVKEAVKDYDIEYPVIQDNNYGTWNAYGNQYWPRDYLIDTQGFIRYNHIGEGDYDQTEKAIQSLLLEGTKQLR
jgi:thiol-disulfide isomerase/thioredoxin